MHSIIFMIIIFLTGIHYCYRTHYNFIELEILFLHHYAYRTFTSPPAAATLPPLLYHHVWLQHSRLLVCIGSEFRYQPACQTIKHLYYSLPFLRRTLRILNFVSLSQLAGPLILLMLHITLVSHQIDALAWNVFL